MAVLRLTWRLPGREINLYVKNGFKKADGVYDEVIDDDLVLHEFGFERMAALV